MEQPPPPAAGEMVKSAQWLSGKKKRHQTPTFSLENAKDHITIVSLLLKRLIHLGS